MLVVVVLIWEIGAVLCESVVLDATVAVLVFAVLVVVELVEVV